MGVPLIIQYLRAKQEFDAAEAKLVELRAAIEPLIEEAGGKIVEGAVTLTLIDVSRESFNLTEARKVLDMRVLNPFIKTSTYKQLRTKVALIA